MIILAIVPNIRVSAWTYDVQIVSDNDPGSLLPVFNNLYLKRCGLLDLSEEANIWTNWTSIKPDSTGG